MTRSSSSSDLAINGGAPVRRDPMPPRLALGAAESAMIDEVLAWYRARDIDPGYQGEFEERYCRAFADFLGGGYADAVATGTGALYVALAALDLPKGAEVLVSPITDPGTISAIILNGLVPRLADSAEGSLQMGAEQVAARLNDATGCVCVVHAAGQATDIDRIVEIARARDIPVLEDCSQAHGATWRGKPVGTFGDIAAFSTMYRKAHITGASGGVVYSRNESLFRRALAHADRGKPRWQEDFDDRDPTTYLFPALNWHTDEISCAIGLASLARLPDTVRRRNAFVEAVKEGLEAESAACRPNRWSSADSPFYYPIFVDERRLSCGKIAFAEAVRAEGIGLNPHYNYLVADWAWIGPYLADDFSCPNARNARDSAFTLYLNENYGPQEVADTLAAIRKVEKHYLL